MVSHFVHYVSREILTPRKNIAPAFYAENQNPEDGFDRPMYHVTRQKSGPVNKITVGSVIWLFSQIKSPWGNLLPSLDAMIEIEKIENPEDGRTKFHATENSKWFPLYDATNIISQLQTIDSKGNLANLRSDNQKPIGFYLQSIRKLSNHEDLVNFSNKVLSADLDFISYRIKDGTQKAFITTDQFMQNDQTVFWDRHSLPRRMTERREYLQDKKLEDHLLKVIRQCRCVHGIETAGYKEKGSYAQKEALFAKDLGKYVPITYE